MEDSFHARPRILSPAATATRKNPGALARRMALRPILLLAVLAALAPVASAAEPFNGPYHGVLVQGQTNAHAYNDLAAYGVCPHYFAPVAYVVTLTWAPTTDTLTLQVPGRTAALSATGGSISVTIPGSGCDTFAITVTGTQVATLARYEVRVGITSAADDS